MGYLHKVVDQMTKKTVVFWGVGRKYRSFLKKLCGPGNWIPHPDYVCDSTRDLTAESACGIPIMAFEDVRRLDPEKTILVTTAGLFELQAQIIPSELYYFPIYHRRSFEVQHYLEKEGARVKEVLSLLSDSYSRNIYESVLGSIINGSFINQSIFEPSPYFGNNLIGKLADGDSIVFAGARDGNQLDRALANNLNITMHAFEPNREWYDFLIRKFESNEKVSIYNKILWHQEEELLFDADAMHSGLDAHVLNPLDSKVGAVMVKATTIDSLSGEKISQVALDVEGSERPALKGCRNIIENQHPKLSICLYHEVEDFVEIPLLINELSKKSYRFYVKQHSCVAPIETVLYAL